MEATLVFALRHGQTAWNAQARIQGHIDVPLDATGRWQATRLAAALAAEPIAVVYCSDLARAHATASALAERCGAPLVLDTGLRERHFGRFEGLTHAELEQLHPEEFGRWRRREPGFAPGGGETPEAFHARAVASASRAAAAHPGQTIAIVAHGGVLDCLYRAATGAALDAPRTWQLGNATVNRLLWNGEGFSLVGWDDHGHLQAEGPGNAADGGADAA